MKTYQVNNGIRHGATKDDVKDYAPGVEIELDEAHAEPLLASGDISGPIGTPAKATIEIDDAHAAPLLASGEISGPVNAAAKNKK